jgi:hypothetical protein
MKHLKTFNFNNITLLHETFKNVLFLITLHFYMKHFKRFIFNNITLLHETFKNVFFLITLHFYMKHLKTTRSPSSFQFPKKCLTAALTVAQINQSDRLCTEVGASSIRLQWIHFTSSRALNCSATRSFCAQLALRTSGNRTCRLI